MKRNINGRVQTKGFDAVKGIQPTALPGSTFVQAPAPQVNPGYAQLADAFGGLSNTLMQLGAKAKAGAASAAKDREDAMPWETLSNEQLDKTVQTGVGPDGNRYAAAKASAVIGKRAGKELEGHLTQHYQAYDPEKHGPLREYMQTEADRIMDERFPLQDERYYAARAGVASVVSPFLDSIEQKEATFKKDAMKTSIEEGSGAEASSILLEGQTRGLPKEAVASNFLASWGSLRSSAQGSRANPMFAGADVDKQFKAAVEGLAESGDDAMVEAILSQQVPGRRASLLKDPADSKWAVETLDKAKKKSLEANRENSWKTLSDAEVLAEKGDLSDRMVEDMVKGGLMDTDEGERIRTKSKIARAQAEEKARQSIAKTEAEKSHLKARDALVADRLAYLSVNGGGEGMFEDMEIPSKDGTGSMTFTAEQQKDEVIKEWYKLHDAQVRNIATSQGQEAAVQFDVDQQLDFFTKNGSLTNKRWTAVFNGVAPGMAVGTLVKGEAVPAHMQRAAILYTQLMKKSPAMASEYVKDEKTRVILEAYRMAKEEVTTFDGGGVATDEQAWGRAARIAKNIDENGGQVQSIRWDDKSSKKVDSAIQAVDRTMIIGTNAKVSSEMRGNVKRLANFYYAAGMNEDEALKQAATEISKDYVRVNGGHLVNAKGIRDREKFVQFMDDTIPTKLGWAADGPQDPDAESGDYQPVYQNGKWLLFDSRGYPVVDMTGEFATITPDDFKRWNGNKEEAAMRDFLEQTQGKYTIPQLVANGFLNAENRGKFWDYKKKWDAEQEKKALYNAAMDSRTGNTKANTFADIGKQAQDATTSGLNSLRQKTGSLFGTGPSATGKTDNPVLNLIHGAEAPDGYDTIYGKSPIKAPKPLTEMTVREVMAFQRQMKAKGSASTAIGQYQFMGYTLPELISEAGIPSDAKFTPELQDQLATMLLKRRGLDDFLAGKISREKFADNLAQEWAGLPLSSGKSRYHGIAGNRATVDRASVLGAIDQLKAGGGASDVIKGSSGAGPAPDQVYANIPKAEVERFKIWNSDPIGNEKANLESVDPRFQKLIARVRELSPVQFVVASGKRDQKLQKHALTWGWSKKPDSNHLSGKAVDVWVLDEKGAVVFDKKRQEELGKYIKQAMQELGLKGQWGGDWKSFQDLPHIELKD